MTSSIKLIAGNRFLLQTGADFKVLGPTSVLLYESKAGVSSWFYTWYDNIYVPIVRLRISYDNKQISLRQNVPIRNEKIYKRGWAHDVSPTLITIKSIPEICISDLEYLIKERSVIKSLERTDVNKTHLQDLDLLVYDTTRTIWKHCYPGTISDKTDVVWKHETDYFDKMFT